jgi:Lactonase, 7-bladed beta-propeller
MGFTSGGFAAVASTNPAPQSPQKFSSGWFEAPHFDQVTVRGACFTLPEASAHMVENPIGCNRNPGEKKMPDSLYVCVLDENKIAAFTIDADTGWLTPQAEVMTSGGPAVLAISPCRHVLYVGHRVQPAISSFRIDPQTGGLTPQGTVSLEHAPTFLATDRTGKYLLSAYYQGGYVTVHPLAGCGKTPKTVD